MKKVHIGLDIGITSVGWAIVDQNLKIIKHGVRLFSTVDDKKTWKLKNETRREKRSMRRQKNRRLNLKLDFIKLLKKHQLIDLEIDPYFKKQYHDNFVKKYIDPKANILELRTLGLTSALSLPQTIQVLYWYLSHRGFKYEIVDDQEQAKTQKDFQPYLDDDKFPVENQTRFFKENGYYRGELNRCFSAKDYLRELTVILKHSGLSEEFINQYLELFMRQRSFEQGPGSEQVYLNKMSPKNYHLISPFSRFEFDKENHTIKIHQNMWDKTIGKCTYLQNENRAPKESLTSLIFNFLNDLNNLKIGQSKLTFNEKIACFKIALDVKECTKKILGYIIKTFKLENESDIEGLRHDKSNKKILTTLSSFHFINKHLKTVGQELKFEDFVKNNAFDLNTIAFFDKIIDTLNKSKDKNTRIKQLKALNLDSNILENLAQGPGFQKTHSLSYQAMRKMLPILLETDLNQMQIAQHYGIKLGFDTTSKFNFKSQKYLPKEWIETIITTPSVKRALKQTINLLNAIIKQEKNLKVENIVIEMARESNNEEVRKSMTDIQKFLEKRRNELKSVIEAIEQDAASRGKEYRKTALEKLWLLEQQKGQDAYDLKQLDTYRVVTDPNYCDIDHIIPRSQSFDNSRNNKVLTKKLNNTLKGQRTPYQWLGDNKELWTKLVSQWSEWYDPKNLPGQSKVFACEKKFQFLISQLDYSDPLIAKDFIARNLVDTRYITKEVLNLLQAFIKNVDQNHPLHRTKIKTINGRMTNYYRKLIEINKKHPLLRPEGIQDGSFDEKGIKQRIWNGHHAEDAVIICYIALKNPQRNKMIEKVLSGLHSNKFDDIAQSWAIEDQDLITKLRDDLNLKMPNVRFSRMLEKKQNIQFANETLYGVKVKDGAIKLVDKINILERKKDQLAVIFDEKYQYEIPMKKYDSKTFEALKQIFKNFESEKYPFKSASKNQKYVELSIFNQNNQPIVRKIKKLKILKAPKDPDQVLWREENKSFYESMNWTELHLFKNQANKYQIIPINALTAKFLNNQNQQTKYQLKPYYFDLLTKYKINQIKPLYIIHRGTIIKDTQNNLYHVCGSDNRKMLLDLKRLDGKPNISSKNKGMQDYWSLNKKIIDCQIVHIDYLGNTYPILKF